MNSLINNQQDNKYKQLRYGLFPISFNGCEIIAVHNAMLLLGKASYFPDMINFFRHNHMCLLLGLFGSNVYKTGSILSKLGIPSIKVGLNDIDSDGIYIISFWNSHPPFHGIHTVTTVVKNGHFFTYNLYSNLGSVALGPKDYAKNRIIRAYKLVE